MNLALWQIINIGTMTESLIEIVKESSSNFEPQNRKVIPSVSHAIHDEEKFARAVINLTMGLEESTKTILNEIIKGMFGNELECLLMRALTCEAFSLRPNGIRMEFLKKFASVAQFNRELEQHSQTHHHPVKLLEEISVAKKEVRMAQKAA